MTITPEDIFRIGKYPLYEFLGISDDIEFHSFLVSEVCADPKDVVAFAEYMSDHYRICEGCKNAYVMLCDLYCEDCLGHKLERF